MNDRCHASCVRLGSAGILLTGPSGSGKSDLALQLIDRGAMLVADDQVELSALDGQLYGTFVAGFAGMIEVRGIGILHLDAVMEPVRLTHHFELAVPVERLPAARSCTFLGIALPTWRLDARAPSAALKVALTIEKGVCPVA
ncbi:HPr kinase/phosphorylase [Pacificimonas sp. ICDLI1SI03]